MYNYYKLELLTKSMNMHCKFSREQIQDQGLWIHLGLGAPPSKIKVGTTRTWLSVKFNHKKGLFYFHIHLYFWLDSDLDVEALNEESRRLLAICSWRFSLASWKAKQHEMINLVSDAIKLLVLHLLKQNPDSLLPRPKKFYKYPNP